MKLTLTRLDERRYETLIVRDDGVRYHLTGVGHMFAIPHDLAHLAVEQTLRLDQAFWGSIADGAVFESMRYLDGRRKPGATAQSKQVLKSNRDRITEAEVLVRIINDALEQGHTADSPELRERVRSRWTPAGQRAQEYSNAEIVAVADAWRRMLDLWTKLPTGGSIEFEWTTQRTRRGSLSASPR